MSEPLIERRLIKTYFSKKPTGPALTVSLLMLGSCALISKLYWAELEISSLLNANYELAVTQGEYWRLLTTIFVHGDMGHLLSNSYMLGILGFFVYAYFGSLMYPLMTLLLTSLVNILILQAYPPQVSLIGASGLVYLLAGFWLTMFIFIERQRSIPRRILVALGVALLILFPTSFEERVSYRAHAYGLIAGIALALLYFSIFKEKIRSAEKWKEILEEDPPEELLQ